MDLLKILSIIGPQFPPTPSEMIKEAEEKETAAASEVDADRRRDLYQSALNLRRGCILSMDAEDSTEHAAQLEACLSDIEKLLPLVEDSTELISRQIAVLSLLFSMSTGRWKEYLFSIGTALTKKVENDLRLEYRMDALEDYHHAAILLRYVYYHTEQPDEELLAAEKTPELALTDVQERLLSEILPEEFIPVLLSKLFKDYSETIKEFSVPENADSCL